MDRVVLTPKELLTIITDNEFDADGNIVLSKAATAAILAAARRLLSTRKPRVNLRNPSVMREYKARLVMELDANREAIAHGGKLIMEAEASRAIGLSASTVGKNKTLHNVYMTYRRAVCNIKPATVDNDRQRSRRRV